MRVLSRVSSRCHHTAGPHLEETGLAPLLPIGVLAALLEDVRLPGVSCQTLIGLPSARLVSAAVGVEPCVGILWMMRSS